MTLSGASAGTLPHSYLKLLIKNLLINWRSAVGEGEGLSPGFETDGNQFEFIGGRWVFNLKVKNFYPGTYTVKMRPPLNMYRIDPTCRAKFVVEK